MLTFDDVTKCYGSRTAVDHLSVEVARGEVFGLLGPNGAGKTTTVLMAIGALAPDRGAVRIGTGGTPTDPAVRAAIGVAPQTLSLYDRLTGEENLRFFASLYPSARRPRSTIDWALDFVGLSDRRRDLVGTYSGGMKRRLNLAAAVLHDPELIVLDEPTVGVDPQSRNALFDSVRTLKSRGKAILYTTHYMEEAERLCDRVGIIDHGRLLALDSVGRLISAHGGPQTLVIDSGGEPVRLETLHPLQALNEFAAGKPVEGFHVERPTLEQVFLNLTGRGLRD